MSLDSYIAGGGDGFDMFSKYEEIESTSNTDNKALITYIKDVLKVKDMLLDNIFDVNNIFSV